MSQKDQVNQETLAAEWGLALESEGGAKAGGALADAAGGDATEASASEQNLAAQWGGLAGDASVFNQASKGGAERVLNQDEIDSLLGFSLADVSLTDRSGIRAIIDSAMVSYERLPMLEIVFDRLVRLMTTSLRNFT
ncbi:MAG: flagellar motor switch protein FliM, partial [Pseudolabrys sp.]|nr:flagellar motor switch protein FliM [Pseudolabrys sp.]